MYYQISVECLGLDSGQDLFIYILAVPALRCCLGFHLVAVSEGYSLVVVRGLLLAVASLVEDRRL